MLQQQNRRKAKRFSVRLKVFEQETSTLLGYCEEISISGLRLMGITPPPSNKELKVWLDGTGDDHGIKLTLFRVWSSVTDTEPRYFYSGMHMVDPDEQALDKIQDLIDDLFC